MISEEIAALCNKAKTVYIASASRTGEPHLAVADNMIIADHEHVVFTSWFCHKTIENLKDNPYISLAVWDDTINRGYQLLGDAEEIKDIAILNGFAPQEEEQGLPQVESRLTIRVKKILRFNLGPHSDQEIG
jgi:predicted pyridoxine 5'-phosphate oxidase superfamily flavin-nucleotide-binding protein